MILNRTSYQNQDFDAIPIKKEWNMPSERENRMHSIHSYPAKFPAFITTMAIKKAEEMNIRVETVADIFCGCGTVAFETVRSGKRFWGCDINPVATLIAETKSHMYKDTLLVNYYDAIMCYFSKREINHEDPIYSNSRIHYWFDDEHIDDLLCLRTSILKNTNNKKYRNFFLCAFSNILKPCSRWLTKSIKPQVDPNKKAKSVKEAFEFQFSLMRKANLENQMEKQGKSKIETLNFLNKNVRRPFADLVVTSPPYVTSYEYADLHQLSTMWLGYTNDFRTLREGTIGSLYHSMLYEDNFKLLNQTGTEIISNLKNVRKTKLHSIAQYYVDMQEAVKKVSKILRPNGACLFVIGNTEFKGVKIDNAKHLTECLFNEGFNEVSVDRRKISNKILTPYRDKSGKFASDKGSSRKIYSEEFVIMAKKTF